MSAVTTDWTSPETIDRPAIAPPIAPRRARANPSTTRSAVADNPDLARLQFRPSGNWANNLGIMYATGSSVPQDFAKAASWFHESARRKGDANSQYNLGILYYNGRGVALDHDEAARWFHKAAEQGDARARANLGLLDRSGARLLRTNGKVELRQLQEQTATDVALNGWSNATGWFTNFRRRLIARYRHWRSGRNTKAELDQYKPEKLASFGVAETDIDRFVRIVSSLSRASEIHPPVHAGRSCAAHW
jgi:uncharacterized protein YjiS (DUF1127 family)